MWKEANKNGKGHDQKCCVVARQGTMLCCGWQTGAKLMGLLPEIWGAQGGARGQIPASSGRHQSF